MEPAKSAIVVAHPDDEILWFGSMVSSVHRIVMCYADNPTLVRRGGQRRKVVESYPLAGIELLDIPEPDAGGAREMERHRLRQDLLGQLRLHLRGITRVFTHNPWGEYGHRHHKMVHSAVAELAREMEIEVFVSCYVGVAVLSQCGEVLRRGVAEESTGTVDRDLVSTIQSLYLKHGCWTWQKNWIWPEQEHFYRLGGAEIGTNRIVSLHIVRPPWQVTR